MTPPATWWYRLVGYLTSDALRERVHDSLHRRAPQPHHRIFPLVRHRNSDRCLIAEISSEHTKKRDIISILSRRISTTSMYQVALKLYNQIFIALVFFILL